MSFPHATAWLAALSVAVSTLYSASPCATAGQEPAKYIVLGAASDPKTFNPMLAQETSSTEILEFLFEGLTRFNPRTGAIDPALAERWETSADGLQWTFFLRKDARWSDGTAFSSDDVLFTFDLLYNPAILAAARDVFTFEGKPIKVEKKDDHTVIFTLPVPFAPFLLALGFSILPKHLLQEKLDSGAFQNSWGIDTDLKRIAGTGPFRFKSYRAGERVELEKNPFYWRKGPGGKSLPRLDKIIFLIIPSPEGRLLKFMEGETDAYGVTGLDYPVLSPKQEKLGFTLFRTGPGMGSNFIAFNQSSADPQKKALFGDPEFRRAVALSLDRQNMIDIILNRLGEKQCSPVSPSTPHFFNAEVPCHDYDPAGARSLLESRGFADRNGDGILETLDGKPLEFVLYTNADNPERVSIAQMAREDMHRAGIKVHLSVIEFNSLVTRLLVSRDWDAVLIGFTGSSEPHFGANVWKVDGRLHFWNTFENAKLNPSEARIDQIFSEAVRTIDTSARIRLYREWQAIAAKELPHIYTIMPEVIYAVNNRLLHVEPTVLGGIFYNIEELDVKRA